MQLSNMDLLAGSERFCKGLREGLMPSISAREMDLITQASALLQDFRIGKKNILDQQRQRPSTGWGSRGNFQYIPVSFFVRHHKGHLQIYWQDVHVSKVTKARRFKYRPKGNGDSYGLHELLRKAGPIADLVRDTERKATVIRRQWRLCGDIKRAVRNGLLTMDANPLDLPAAEPDSPSRKIGPLVLS